MARIVNKQNNVNQQPPRPSKKPIAERQESAKGDMFFKVVISIIFLAIIGVLIYFLIVSLLPDQEDEGPRFVHNQHIIGSDLENVRRSAADPAQIALIINPELRDVMSSPEAFTTIYFVIWNSLWEDEFDSDSVAYRRHSEMWAQLDALMSMEEATRVADGDREGFIYFNNIAVFFLLLNVPDNLPIIHAVVEDERDPQSPGFIDFNSPILITFDLTAVDGAVVSGLSYNDQVASALKNVITYVRYGVIEDDPEEYDF